MSIYSEELIYPNRISLKKNKHIFLDVMSNICKIKGEKYEIKKNIFVYNCIISGFLIQLIENKTKNKKIKIHKNISKFDKSNIEILEIFHKINDNFEIIVNKSDSHTILFKIYNDDVEENQINIAFQINQISFKDY